ncbi:MAG TPA: hypothetical protein VN811_10310, partial [Thermoanaerobaculia bacterium]|nr:hypothetical protein [Thermoanaerobaculia bacterium]
ASGAALPFAAFALWLLHYGLVGDFLDATLGRGAASKGTLVEVLLRPLIGAWTQPAWRQAATAAVLLVALVPVLRRQAKSAATTTAHRPLFVAACLGLLALMASAVWNDLRVARCVAIYVAALHCLAVTLALAWRSRRAELAERDRQRLLLAATGFALFYLFGLSWGLWELMLIPGLAFTIAEALDGLPAERRGLVVRRLVAAAALLLIALTVVDKLDRPYRWGEWEEPPATTANVPARSPFLAGLRLSPSTAAFVDTVTRAIDDHSRPGDRILAFPHLALFYLLADREPATFAYAHWFDMTPDHVAERDANALLTDPPAAILVYDVSPVTWRAHEDVYRGGHPSGQRRLLAAVGQLIGRGDYTVVSKLRAPLTENEVTVWARRGPRLGAPRPPPPSG